MRAAELESAMAYRDRGESDLDRNDEIQLHEVPARAASYGVQSYVATGTQQQIATERRVTPKKVVERFLALARAAEAGADAVRALVPDTQYANAFVAGFSEIAAHGDDVGSVSCSAPTWRFRAPTVVLGAEHRRNLKAAVPETVPREPAKNEKVIEGVLTKVELKKGWNWATLELGNGAEEIVLIEDKALRVKAAGLRASDDDVRVRAVVRRSEKKRRLVLIDVHPLSKRGKP